MHEMSSMNAATALVYSRLFIPVQFPAPVAVAAWGFSFPLKQLLNTLGADNFPHGISHSSPQKTP